jgi:hypothetical protein
LRATARRSLARVRALARALAQIVDSDDATIASEFERLTRSHRALAPLAFTLTAFSMLLDGLRLLISNRRLLFVSIPGAAWIWLAMYDLKAHVLHGRSLNVIKGPILIPIGLVIVAITIAVFFLNAVFAFAIDGPRPPDIRRAFARARTNMRAVVVAGATVGVPLAIATIVAPRWGRPWFGITLSVVVGILMVSYVAVPARLIGARSDAPRRDRLTASVLSTVIGTTVCTPPYLVLRLGILMLGSRVLLIPGILVLVVGATLQAGATGAVRAIKLNAALSSAERQDGARSP